MPSKVNNSSTTFSTGNICPKCKKVKSEERIPRGILVRYLLFWMPIKRYRCHNCLRKSYKIIADDKTKVSNYKAKMGSSKN